MLEALHVLSLLEHNSRAAGERLAAAGNDQAPLAQLGPGTPAPQANVALARAELAADLKTLCLPSIAAPWPRLAEKAHRQRQGHAEYLADLVNLELSQRQQRRIARLAGKALRCRRRYRLDDGASACA